MVAADLVQYFNVAKKGKRELTSLNLMKAFDTVFLGMPVRAFASERHPKRIVSTGRQL